MSATGQHGSERTLFAGGFPLPPRHPPTVQTLRLRLAPTSGIFVETHRDRFSGMARAARLGRVQKCRDGSRPESAGSMKYTADRWSRQSRASANAARARVRGCAGWPDLHWEDQRAFLFGDKGTPAEYSAGLALAIERGWLTLHESGTYVKFTQGDANMFAW